MHFTELIESQVIGPPENNYINVFRMDMYSTKPDDDIIHSIDSETVMAPLYKLRLGMSKSSEGIACARAAGVGFPNNNLSILYTTIVIPQVYQKPSQTEQKK